LFTYSFVGLLISFVTVFIALFLWYPLARNWNPDQSHIGAYVDAVIILLSAIVAVLSGIGLAISCSSRKRPTT